MNFSDFIKIALLFILSSCSFGGIVVGVIKFCSNIIAERLSKKYDLKLQKEIERYKESLEKSNYVSKVKFDLEIKIYKDLCSSLFAAKESVLLLFPYTDSIPPDKDSQMKMWKERYSQAATDYNSYCESMSSNAAFIPEDIYNGFEEIQKLFNTQINWFKISGKLEAGKIIHGSIDDEKGIYARNEEIDKKRKILILKLREYLNYLEVLEN